MQAWAILLVEFQASPRRKGFEWFTSVERCWCKGSCKTLRSTRRRERKRWRLRCTLITLEVRSCQKKQPILSSLDCKQMELDVLKQGSIFLLAVSSCAPNSCVSSPSQTQTNALCTGKVLLQWAGYMQKSLCTMRHVFWPVSLDDAAHYHNVLCCRLNASIPNLTKK